MKEKKEEIANFEELQRKIGYSFRDTRLLEQALSHSSYVNECRKEKKKDNERLEYLGDAVLELSTSDVLFHNYPGMSEGEMTKLRASLVCEPSLAICARQIGLPEHLLLGKGEEITGGRNRDSVISDAMEALIGAIYLDSGFDTACGFIRRFILNDIEHRKLFSDSKTILQEIVQKQHPNEDISYELVREEGPDHAKQFIVRLVIDGVTMGEGAGTTKKGAEQSAAYSALMRMRGEEPKLFAMQPGPGKKEQQPQQ